VSQEMKRSREMYSLCALRRDQLSKRSSLYERRVVTRDQLSMSVAERSTRSEIISLSLYQRRGVTRDQQINSLCALRCHERSRDQLSMRVKRSTLYAHHLYMRVAVSREINRSTLYARRGEINSLRAHLFISVAVSQQINRSSLYESRSVARHLSMRVAERSTL